MDERGITLVSVPSGLPAALIQTTSRREKKI
jgi:hypothetical protein